MASGSNPKQTKTTPQDLKPLVLHDWMNTLQVPCYLKCPDMHLSFFFFLLVFPLFLFLLWFLRVRWTPNASIQGPNLAPAPRFDLRYWGWSTLLVSGSRFCYRHRDGFANDVSYTTYDLSVAGIYQARGGQQRGVFLGARA